ncbi:hypothetical protein Taro_030769 [Colocasia esculenta]|uniref:Growth-regulating factor n=1 Tax=Colocasia esculenta TaxID=4460 RepID=A0A843VH63_COLES|nr:hypothetical protein [Colocasia esculenta]
MDLGRVMGIEGLVGSSSDIGVGGGCGAFSSSLVSSDIDSITQRGLYRSGFLKQTRSGGADDGDWRYLKVPRSEPAMLASSKASPSLSSHAHSLFPEGQQMLSFSSPKPDALVLCGDGSSPYYHSSASSLSAASSSYSRNAGVRGPFTPSQWLELEHQALIYKYIDANVPVPTSLLIPIRKSPNSPGFPAYSTGSLRTNSLGWSPFHLGFSGNADPEPGRCRRTDGKKWRCSRDAVADQKYCERHMNRGRHRSRKPVEGHSGHAAKAMSIITPTASAVPSGGSSNSLGIAQQQMKCLQPDSTDPSHTQFTRIMMNKENVNDEIRSSQGPSMPTSLNQKPKETLFPLPKQHNPFEISSSRGDFRIVTSESLLNNPRSPYLESRSFVPSPELNGGESQPNPLRHFFDDWPKGRSNRLTISWPDVEEIQSDRTQLSISIPMASSDFSSSSLSPVHEKLTLSPFKSTRETESIQMGLGVGGILNEMSQREASWVPISWEPSMGGPLGEVLNKTSNASVDHSKNTSSSSLNLMTEDWDSSPRLASSPTGVLQKTTFASLSGSTGSSPRAETHRTHDSTSSMCDDLLGSTLVNSTSIPTL